MRETHFRDCVDAMQLDVRFRLHIEFIVLWYQLTAGRDPGDLDANLNSANFLLSCFFVLCVFVFVSTFVSISMCLFFFFSFFSVALACSFSSNLSLSLSLSLSLTLWARDYEKSPVSGSRDTATSRNTVTRLHGGTPPANCKRSLLLQRYRRQWVSSAPPFCLSLSVSLSLSPLCLLLSLMLSVSYAKQQRSSPLSPPSPDSSP